MIKYVILILGACYGLLQAAMLSGVVIDSAAGTKLNSVIVQLRSGTKVRAIDTTNAEGAYSFANIDTGRYTVRASLVGYAAKSVSAKVSNSTPVTVAIPLVKIIAATIAGTVKDSSTGIVLAAASVQLLSGKGVVELGKSGADGKYSFENMPVDTYTVSASLSGYVVKSLTAAVTSSTPVTIDIPLAAVVTATVGGAVTDSSTATAIAGAVAQLRSGARIVAVDTSGSDGAFSFTKVEVGTYSIRVSFSGYKTKSINASVTGSSALTVNVPIARAAYGAVVGTVTADSLWGKTLDQVTIVLNRNGTPVDTATSDAQGRYSFDKVETGLDYILSGSKTGYRASTASLVNKNNGADSIHFFMVTLVTKNIRVFVLKTADSSAIAQASAVISASGGNMVISGVTDATGNALFEKMEEGEHVISASATGFTAVSRRYTINAASADSIKIYLAKATGGTKTLCGIVIDSVSGNPLANVTISIPSGGSGGAPITLATTTAANGAYTIAGIPIATTATILTATRMDYKTSARTVALGDSTVDTIKFDFKIISNSAVVNSERKVAPINAGRPRVSISSDGLISLFNFNGTGVVRLFDLNGKALYQCPFNSVGHSVLRLHKHVRLPKTTFIIRVSRSDGSTMTEKAILTHR